MTALQVRDFPEDLYLELKETAVSEGRSMAQQTVIAVREYIRRRNRKGFWVTTEVVDRQVPVGPYTEADYLALPDGARAELIGGELFDMTPPGRQHQRLVQGIFRKLADYVDAQGGPCEVDAAPFSVNLNGDGSVFVEPDVLVVCDPAKLSDRGCEGAPDLVVEVVSPSSEHRDYLVKTNLYKLAGVREYWIVDPKVSSTTVYVFDSQSLAPHVYPFGESVPVSIYPGFGIVVGGLS